jgi:hypothetical protein
MRSYHFDMTSSTVATALRRDRNAGVQERPLQRQGVEQEFSRSGDDDGLAFNRKTS